MVTVEAARLRSEARTAGLGRCESITLREVERRRTQVWLLATFTLAGVGGILVMSRAGRPSDLWHSVPLQGLLGALALGMGVYVADRERRLRRLTRLLVDERAVSAALAERVSEVGTMLGVAKAMNSTLGLDVVLARIADAAVTMLGASEAAVAVTDGEVLGVVATSGSGAAPGGEVAGDSPAFGVTRTWEVTVAPPTTPGGPAVHAPLLHSNQLLGVLSVSGPAGRAFDACGVRTVQLFAEQAACAIAQTHRAEAARWQDAERARRIDERVGSMRLAMAELREPIASLETASRILEGCELTDDDRKGLAAVIDRQAKRLGRAAERILADGD